MGGSGWRESSIGCRLRRLLYAFSGIGRAEFSKKMQSLIDTEWTAFECEVPPRSGALNARGFFAERRQKFGALVHST
jgi:hypothetical protein